MKKIIANYIKSHFDSNKTNDISMAVILSNTIKFDNFPRNSQSLKKLLQRRQSYDQI